MGKEGIGNREAIEKRRGMQTGEGERREKEEEGRSKTRKIRMTTGEGGRREKKDKRRVVACWGSRQKGEEGRRTEKGSRRQVKGDAEWRRK
jgi:hypothetical protein